MSHAQQAGLALKGIGVVQQPDSMQPDKKHDRELLLAAQKMLGGKLPKGSDGMPSMFWGSGAISFSAIMAMLKAALEAMNDYAKTQQKTAVLEGDTITRGADATYQSTMDDASNLMFQMGEQIGSALAGGLTIFGAYKGLQGTRPASVNLNEMEGLCKQVNEEEITLAEGADGAGALHRAPRSPEKAAALKQFRDEIDQNTFNYKGKSSIHQVLDHPTEQVTLKEVLESCEDADELKRLKTRIGEGREQSRKDLAAAQNNSQVSSTMFQTVGSVTAGIGGSVMKTQESRVTGDKAGASAAQQNYQQGAQIVSKTADAQGQSSSAAYQDIQKAFQSLQTLVQIDSRG